MSNLEAAPDEITCSADPARARPEVLEPRPVPLGGPRAMQVRRTLPQRARSLIGAWCFVDHYGSDDVAGGMAVPGHPHTGLQTVSWLFDGRIDHRDTTGAHAVVSPGEVNLMTAGSGIAHSEFATPDTGTAERAGGTAERLLDRTAVRPIHARPSTPRTTTRDRPKGPRS